MYIKTIAADIIILHTIFVLPYRFTSRQSVPKYFTNNIFLAILNYESLPKYFTYNICIATSIYIKTISADIFYIQYLSFQIILHFRIFNMHQYNHWWNTLIRFCLAIIIYTKKSVPKYFTYTIFLAISIYIKTIAADIFYIQYLYCHIDLHQDNQCRNILHTIFVLPY